jgi:hypothetical protein
MRLPSWLTRWAALAVLALLCGAVLAQAPPKDSRPKKKKTTRKAKAGPKRTGSSRPTRARRPGRHRSRLLGQADKQGNRIPDFSNCGYGGGGVPLPRVPVRATVEPTSSDAGSVIQSAIDKVSALPPDKNGFRGAVLLKKGTYRISGSIHIRTRGVVLRGEGQGIDGTVLLATGNRKRTLVEVGGKGKWREQSDTRRAIADNYVPVGARTFAVVDASSFVVGDWVMVHRPSTKEWLHAIGMDRIPQAKGGKKISQWTPGSKDLHFDRRVTKVDGNTITLDAPLTCALEKKYGGGWVFKYDYPGRIRKVGVEELSGDSEYKGATDEKHAWDFIDLHAVENAWVRKVTAVHFGNSAVVTNEGAKWVTVEDCSCLDPVSKTTGGRRYSFHINKGQLTLWQRCRTRQGRHDFVTGSVVAGPNVFLDCTAEKARADSGPHQRWAVGILYDGVSTSGALNVQNRGNKGSGQGWAGANHVLWNCKAGSIKCDRPPTANNWAIGCTAKKLTGNGTWESKGDRVEPASLYKFQLAERRSKGK